MALPTGYAGVFDPVNVAGVLYSKTDTRTPLFNMLGGFTTASREFLVSSEYELGAASQPAISETASVTAPTPTFTDREQSKNVTQIFQKSIAVTYRKMSDTASLTGLNIEGLENNVPNELATQIAHRIAEMRNDMEYTILNGAYNLATTADEIDKTRGLIAATDSHEIAAGGDELNPELLIRLAKSLHDNSPFGLQGIVGILNSEQMVQLNKIVLAEGQRVSMSEAGSNMLRYNTPFGVLNFLEGGHRYMPNGTALFANLSVCRNAVQPVPGKGFAFYEPLSKTGAAETGQVYAQWGLDHGPEWMHAKITGLAETTTATTAPQVFITNSSEAPVYTSAVS